MKGIIKIQTDPSGRSTCHGCNKVIVKGTTRVVETIGSGKWQKVHKYCGLCGRDVIDIVINELQFMREGL